MSRLSLVGLALVLALVVLAVLGDRVSGYRFDEKDIAGMHPARFGVEGRRSLLVFKQSVPGRSSFLSVRFHVLDVEQVTFADDAEDFTMIDYGRRSDALVGQ